MTRSAFLVVLLAGCFNPLDNPDPTDRCIAHDTREACAADDACSAAECPQCNGQPAFSGCFLKNNASPSAACPAISCVDKCQAHLDQTSCDADESCVSLTCPGCGQPDFIQCANKDSGLILECEPHSCPARCPSYTTDAQCSADPSCYSVFEEFGACDCAGFGCCMTFTYCATGAPLCGTMPDCGFSSTDCGETLTPIIVDSCTPACTHDSLCAMPD